MKYSLVKQIPFRPLRIIILFILILPRLHLFIPDLIKSINIKIKNIIKKISLLKQSTINFIKPYLLNISSKTFYFLTQNKIINITHPWHRNLTRVIFLITFYSIIIVPSLQSFGGIESALNKATDISFLKFIANINTEITIIILGSVSAMFIYFVEQQLYLDRCKTFLKKITGLYLDNDHLNNEKKYELINKKNARLIQIINSEITDRNTKLNLARKLVSLNRLENHTDEDELLDSLDKLLKPLLESSHLSPTDNTATIQKYILIKYFVNIFSSLAAVLLILLRTISSVGSKLPGVEKFFSKFLGGGILFGTYAISNADVLLDYYYTIKNYFGYNYKVSADIHRENHNTAKLTKLLFFINTYCKPSIDDQILFASIYMLDTTSMDIYTTVIPPFSIIHKNKTPHNILLQQFKFILNKVLHYLYWIAAAAGSCKAFYSIPKLLQQRSDPVKYDLLGLSTQCSPISPYYRSMLFCNKYDQSLYSQEENYLFGNFITILSITAFAYSLLVEYRTLYFFYKQKVLEHPFFTQQKKSDDFEKIQELKLELLEIKEKLGIQQIQQNQTIIKLLIKANVIRDIHRIKIPKTYHPIHKLYAYAVTSALLYILRPIISIIPDILGFLVVYSKITGTDTESNKDCQSILIITVILAAISYMVKAAKSFSEQFDLTINTFGRMNEHFYEIEYFDGSRTTISNEQAIKKLEYSIKTILEEYYCYHDLTTVTTHLDPPAVSTPIRRLSRTGSFDGGVPLSPVALFKPLTPTAEAPGQQ